MSHPPLPNPLQYATPSGFGVIMPGAIYAEGGLVVSPPTVSFPPRCVYCNEPETKRVTMRYAWHHPALYLLILPGLLIYAIVALVVRKKGTAQIGLCSLHAVRRFRKRVIFWLVPLMMIGVIVAGPVLESLHIVRRDGSIPFIILGIVGLIVTVVVAASSGHMLRAKFIDTNTMKLGGAGGAFLRSLGDAPRMPVAQPVV